MHIAKKATITEESLRKKYLREGEDADHRIMLVHVKDDMLNEVKANGGTTSRYYEIIDNFADLKAKSDKLPPLSEVIDKKVWDAYSKKFFDEKGALVRKHRIEVENLDLGDFGEDFLEMIQKQFREGKNWRPV